MATRKQVVDRTFIDQYGQVHRAPTVRELRDKLGGSCGKMYQDKANGLTVHVGYVIGHLWLTEYAPVERPA